MAALSAFFTGIRNCVKREMVVNLEIQKECKASVGGTPLAEVLAAPQPGLAFWLLFCVHQRGAPGGFPDSAEQLIDDSLAKGS